VAGTSNSNADIAFIGICHLMKLILLDNTCVEMLMNLPLVELESTTWGNGIAEILLLMERGSRSFYSQPGVFAVTLWLGKHQLPNVLNIVTQHTLLY